MKPECKNCELIKAYYLTARKHEAEIDRLKRQLKRLEKSKQLKFEFNLN